MKHAPDGFQTITPYFLLEDWKGFLDFAERGLGATIGQTHEAEGRLVHGEFEVHGSVLEIGQPQGNFEPTRMSLHVFVENPDVAWKQAVDAGATALYEVADHPYGERSGGVADAWGNQWYFAKVIDHKARSGS